jgi:hypothetical protein
MVEIVERFEDFVGEKMGEMVENFLQGLEMPSRKTLEGFE